jgi:hypothetical protein
MFYKQEPFAPLRLQSLTERYNNENSKQFVFLSLVLVFLFIFIICVIFIYLLIYKKNLIIRRKSKLPAHIERL